MRGKRKQKQDQKSQKVQWFLPQSCTLKVSSKEFDLSWAKRILRLLTGIVNKMKCKSCPFVSSEREKGGATTRGQSASLVLEATLIQR